MRNRTTVAAVLLAVAAAGGGPVDPDRSATAGDALVADGKLLHPAGTATAVLGKPVDLAVTPDGRFLLVKATHGLTVVDARTGAVTKSIGFKKEEKNGGSMHGLSVVADPAGGYVAYYSSTGRALLTATISAAGEPAWGKPVPLPGTYNLGVAVSPDGRTAYVCMSAANTLGVVDLAAGKLARQVPVGVAPYAVALSPDGATAYVTNFGGRHPTAGQRKADSYGTAVAVDARDVPNSGTVSRVDLRSFRQTAEVDVGLHPTQIARDAAGNRYFVADANSDAVSVVDAATGRVAETIDVKPDPGLPFGSIPDALALSPDGRTLYVADAGNNAVAVVSVGTPGRSAVRGFIPTGWFPGAVLAAGDQLFVANTKSASVTRLPPPADEPLKAYTAQSLADARVPEVLREFERAAKSTVPPVPVPARQGDSSLFRHVVYVLKENKTYDQVLGDMGKGNSDPKLCVYGRRVTPNHHALADQFVLLDNYYCNGVNSSDGHQWATQGIIGEYFEKGSRTYDFGTDALCYAGSDFIWNSCLLHGLSVRNYGEFDFPTLTAKPKDWFSVKARLDAGKPTFKQSVQLQALAQYTCREYPGWELAIPDVCRVKPFLAELRQFDRDGKMPDFTLVYLPQDHTSGTGQDYPTPRAMVADNDLALGQVVSALSHSRFWKDTVVFVNEDDPQSGYDHVDAHRSFCLIASPYAKRGVTLGHFYNQTSVLHTMTRILGLPPLNQACAAAPTMEDCFTATPDPRPYEVLPNQVPLDERNKPKAAMAEDERKLADAVDRMDFTVPDRADDDVLNRLNWLAAGRTDPYPAAFAGPHGRGLAALHLRLDAAADDDDDR